MQPFANVPEQHRWVLPTTYLAIATVLAVQLVVGGIDDEGARWGWALTAVAAGIATVANHVGRAVWRRTGRGGALVAAAGVGAVPLSFVALAYVPAVALRGVALAPRLGAMAVVVALVAYRTAQVLPSSTDAEASQVAA